MAKAVLNSGLKSLHGKIDEWVYREVHGKPVISPTPRHRPKRKRSAAETATNTRFTAAAEAAKRAPAELCIRYLERSRQVKKSAWSVRLRDYLTPPTIESINLAGYSGAPGDPILVRATDDFEVKDVHVIVRLAGGQILESGFARRTAEGADAFLYTTTAAPAAGAELTIEVTARDWPENLTTRQAAFVCPRR